MQQNQRSYKDYILFGVLLISLIGATRYAFFKLDPFKISQKTTITKKQENYFIRNDFNIYSSNYDPEKRRLSEIKEGKLEELIEKNEHKR